MGKRYHCDYCNKSFPDNPSSKKNHMSGIHHQRNRKAHYDLFRDAATILAEESLKNPCRKFLQTGDCSFGSGCKFSHLTAEERKNLEEKALLEKERKKLDSENFNVDNWIKRRKLGNLNSCNSDIPNENYSEKEHDTTPLTLPPLLQNIANLPISLLPCPALPEDFKPDQWG